MAKAPTTTNVIIEGGLRYPPAGATWPGEMRADMAAAYCDEPTVQAFRRKVQLGVYPSPIQQAGCAGKWRKLDLDTRLQRKRNNQSFAFDLAEELS
jgi:hypothetical protein